MNAYFQSKDKNMHIHFIIHEHFEAPGAYEAWATTYCHTITYSRLYQGERLPESVENIDFLIVMGGPQSPDTPSNNALISILKKSKKSLKRQ